MQNLHKFKTKMLFACFFHVNSCYTCFFTEKVYKTCDTYETSIYTFPVKNQAKKKDHPRAAVRQKRKGK